jgi:hypothetical protein
MFYFSLSDPASLPLAIFTRIPLEYAPFRFNTLLLPRTGFRYVWQFQA